MVHVLHLKKRSDFLRVSKNRRFFATSSVVVQFFEQTSVASQKKEEIEDVVVRVGFTASRKVGGAVLRNRAKRRLRVIADKLLSVWTGSACDVVFIARSSTPTVSFEQLEKECRLALQKCSVMSEKK